jgi:hypothetical protein
MIQVTGPWVLVVGMHRSGTSAITGALGAVGMHLVATDDRVEWLESNPEHWESLSLVLHNADLLARLGGAWDGPPEMDKGWERSPEIADLVDPTALLVAAYPEPGPKVFKDPRLSLLLPYWRNLLPDPIAAVLVWRSPTGVARSLEKRDGMPLVEGIALWERYNRQAIEGLVGLDTYVLEYESVVTDGGKSLEALITWLGSLDQFKGESDRWDAGAASKTIAGDLLHHQPDDSEADEVVLREQRELADYLSTMSGGHRPFTPELFGSESPWTTSVLNLRSELSAPRKEFEDTKEELEYTKEWLENIRSSTSWRITKPMRTLTTRLDGRRGHPTDPTDASDQ